VFVSSFVSKKYGGTKKKVLSAVVVIIQSFCSTRKTIINGAARSAAVLSVLIDRCRSLATSLTMARAEKHTSKFMVAATMTTDSKIHATRVRGPKRQWQVQQVLPVRKIDHNLLCSKEWKGKQLSIRRASALF
jgi:hypothetical protein